MCSIYRACFFFTVLQYFDVCALLQLKNCVKIIINNPYNETTGVTLTGNVMNV